MITMFKAEEDKESFPAGLRVLVVDDDPTTLRLLERLLEACKYQVTKCQQASDALSLLRQNEGSFDIVLSDIHMPGISGLQLLETIILEMDLPVVMMSQDDRKDMVMKIVTKGACDYLLKPIRIEEIKVIWQHVVRKRRNNSKLCVQSDFLPSNDRGGRRHHHHNHKKFETPFRGIKESNATSNCVVKHEKYHHHGHKDTAVSIKKPRMVWTDELHHHFVAIVNHMGLDNAVPKKILELMKVPGLTRENVASHLQKYRLNIKRKNENTPTKLRAAPLHVQNVLHPCFGDHSNSPAYAISEQLESQNSIFTEMDHAQAEGLSIMHVGTPLDQQITCYNQRLASDLMFETGKQQQQQSWYHGCTELSNHLPRHDHGTSTIIVESEQDKFAVMEKLQSSFTMEISNELAMNEALNPDDAAVFMTMKLLEDEDEDEVDVQDAQNESTFFVNSRDPEYPGSSRYEHIFLMGQHNQEDPNLDD